MMRLSGFGLLLTVAAVVGAIIAVDLMEPSEATSRPEPVEAGPAVAGAWYCAAGAVGENDEVVVVTAATTASTDPADAEVTALHGDRTLVASHPVFPGSARRTVLPGDLGEGPVGVAARWWERPVVASRVWRSSLPDGVAGTVSGPCAVAPSPTWYVAGVSTAEGGTARLYLANPFATDASVAVSFTTPTGLQEPIRLQNVSVGARSVVELELNEFLPREPDLGIVVQARSGRVVAEAVQQLDAAIGGVNGRALVRAAPQLAETWTIPWSLMDPVAFGDDDAPEPDPDDPDDPDGGSDDPTEETAAAEQGADGSIVSTTSPGNGTTSWLWVSNPTTDAAAVTLTLHTERGAVVPDIGDEILIEPGRITRIDLRGLLPAGLSTAGATLRSENGVPVVASVSTLMRPDVADPSVTGYTSQLGWPEPDTSWVVPGEAPGTRRQVIHVVNPGADTAVVDVALWNGAVLSRPAGLQDVEVGPGQLVEFLVSDVVSGATHMVAYVTSSAAPIVVGRHSVGGSPVEWIAHTGVPASLWSGGAIVPAVNHDPYLLEQLGAVVDRAGEDDVSAR